MHQVLYDIVVVLFGKVVHIDSLRVREADVVVFGQVLQRIVAFVAVIGVRVDHRYICPPKCSEQRYIKFKKFKLHNT